MNAFVAYFCMGMNAFVVRCAILHMGINAFVAILLAETMVPASKVPIYLIGISFFFFCSGTIFSQFIVKRPSLSSAPLTFTSSAIVNDLENDL